jgi:hypothetical protein
MIKKNAQLGLDKVQTLINKVQGIGGWVGNQSRANELEYTSVTLDSL